MRKNIVPQPRSLATSDFASHPDKLRVAFQLGGKNFDLAFRKNKVLVGQNATHSIDIGNGVVEKEPMLSDGNCFYQGDAVEIKDNGAEEGVGVGRGVRLLWEGFSFSVSI